MRRGQPDATRGIPSCEGSTGHPRHRGGRGPEDPDAEFPRARPARVRSRPRLSICAGFHVPGHLDHDDEPLSTRRPAGSASGLAERPSLAETPPLRTGDLPHSDASAAADEERTEQVAAHRRLARRLPAAQPGPAPPGPARCSASGSQAGYVRGERPPVNASMTCSVRSLPLRTGRRSTATVRIAVSAPCEPIRRPLAPQL